MREGLRIITLPAGYYPYVQVGWCRRREGDEWDLVGGRVIRRFGPNVQLVQLAAKGPQAGTILLDASAEPEEFHRLRISRCIPCNEEAWHKDCPKPKEWHR